MMMNSAESSKLESLARPRSCALKSGDHVIHRARPGWGVGTVLEIRADKIRLAFDRVGLKTLKGAPLRSASWEELEKRAKDARRSPRKATSSDCEEPHHRLPQRFRFCPYCGIFLRPSPPGVRNPVFTDTPMSDLYAYCKQDFPEHIAFVQNGYFWEVYDDDARKCHQLFGWALASKGCLTMTGVPLTAKRFEQDLREMKQPHLFVAQLQYGVTGERVQRGVTEIWP